MKRLYLLINTVVGKERSVRNALRQVPGVHQADMITGRYDIIAVVEESGEEIPYSLILEKVRSIDGITRTETNLVVE
jgi:DNA-binding Lrp family transcriptional regulator